MNRVIISMDDLANMTVRIKELKALLREWRGTEFFEDKAKWRQWVFDFGKRVDEALEKKP